MPDNLPMHGRHKGTARAILRTTSGRSLDWRFPDATERQIADRPGTSICPTCHAISTEKRWFLDEPLYEQLKGQDGVTPVVCPGCEQVERGMFDGDVVISGGWLGEHREEVLNLVRNEEAKAREVNPLSRVGTTDDHRDRIELFVTTQSLAERIGKALHRAYKGELAIDHLRSEKFSRVNWRRD